MRAAAAAEMVLKKFKKIYGLQGGGASFRLAPALTTTTTSLLLPVLLSLPLPLLQQQQPQQQQLSYPCSQKLSCSILTKLSHNKSEDPT